MDRFADLQILRYQVPGFDELSLQQKKLIYFLSEAAQSGRDILFDQNGKYNLRIRRTLEAIYLDYKGDRTSDDFKAFEVYLKRVWFANGIHHHYGMDKFTPGFSEEFFKDVLLSVDENLLPIEEGNTIECLYKDIAPVIFDPTIKPKRVNQEDGVDLIETSACNYYQNVTQAEAEAFMLEKDLVMKLLYLTV